MDRQEWTVGYLGLYRAAYSGLEERTDREETDRETTDPGTTDLRQADPGKTDRGTTYRRTDRYLCLYKAAYTRDYKWGFLGSAAREANREE